MGQVQELVIGVQPELDCTGKLRGRNHTTTVISPRGEGTWKPCALQPLSALPSDKIDYDRVE